METYPVIEPELGPTRAAASRQDHERQRGERVDAEALEHGIARVIKAIDKVNRETDGIGAQVLLENTAGQGTCLGWRFEHLAAIIAGVEQSDRVGVCIDTCHTFAAGYPLRTRKEYLSTIEELDRTIGLARVKAFHLNDSKQPLGSRRDCSRAGCAERRCWR